jgi:hypothetical protein
MNLKRFQDLANDPETPRPVRRALDLHKKQIEAAQERLQAMFREKSQVMRGTPPGLQKRAAQDFESRLNEAREEILKIYERALGRARYRELAIQYDELRSEFSRNFVYVVDADGKMRLAEKTVTGTNKGRPLHSMLAGGQNVYAAGEIVIKGVRKDGVLVPKVFVINNGSGHYRPPAAETLEYVRNILSENGFDVENAELRHILFPTVVFDIPIEELWANNFFTQSRRQTETAPEAENQ